MNDILEFFNVLEQLKNTIRYKDSKISRANGRKESTADHSYKMAMMVFTIAKEYKIDIDPLKAIKIALVHDLIEAHTDDIDCSLVFVGKVRKSDKRQAEIEALPKIVKGLSEDTANEITSLWKNYDDCQTNEAKFVKAIDKIEALHTLVFLGKEAFDIPRMIAVVADEPVKNFPALIPLLKKVKIKLKAEFEESGIPWENEYNFGLL